MGKISAMFVLCFLLQGCTVLNTPIHEEWYPSPAKYTWVGIPADKLNDIHKGSDLNKFPYQGKNAMYLQYKKTISGGDSAVYYGNPGNYLGFVYGAGPDSKALNEKIDILKNFVVWANEPKQQRMATEGIHADSDGDEYINLEHMDGPVMLVRASGSIFHCIMVRYCYAAFVNPRAAETMIQELSLVRDAKFRK
ncbi:hypothetical protein FS594_26795 (plasmid) [Rahnella aquatilis]|uniref:Lipoprotein n=1 Tax=Rahnella perminowiae TaxID=2816244 RepID=A0ABS6KVD4_9GAMM|nr:hypothetical protein [Rahnella perminowiae]MBU9833571.1 hypothetical protein [Rahnella perminowiae]UJD92367.1 hypothetical protein FS594_26795 [Rahnella aquatilis]